MYSITIDWKIVGHKENVQRFVNVESRFDVDSVKHERTNIRYIVTVTRLGYMGHEKISEDVFTDKSEAMAFYNAF